MAWLSGFTGKAEEFLNKLDQNAADVLKKSKSRNKLKTDEYLTEVMTTEGLTSSDIYNPLSSENQITNSSMSSNAANGFSSLSKLTQSPSKSSPSHRPTNIKPNGNSKLLQKIHNTDEHLIQFLNDSDTSLLLNGHADKQAVTKDNCKNDDFIADVDVVNGSIKRSSDDFMEINNIVVDDELHKENKMLKNEVRTVNNEMSLLLHRTKAAEKERERLKQELQESQSILSRLQADLQGARLQLASDNERLHNLETENERLSNSLSETSDTNDCSNTEMAVNIEELKQRIIDAQLRESKVTAELTALRDRLRISDEEKIKIDNIKKDLEEQYQTILQRLTDLKTEFEQYKMRAQRTLSNKEQLISELRKSSSDSIGSNILEIELQQLREEKISLTEECQQMANRLETVRNELESTERKLESVKEESSASQIALQDSLLQEQKQREIAEEDCRAQNEELHSIRDELTRQKMRLTERLRDREAELTRLRSQLTQRPSSPERVPQEIEARLTALTSSLVQKQASVEVLASEKNALRLRLEKTEHKYREAVKLLNQIQGKMINVNDTDDAKAQVPSFLIESPFDTGVTRRVKRAYSSLDAVGIRTSLFLRRYPLARLLIMFYVVVLHLWVFLVLFSYTPTPDSSSNMKP